MGFERFEKSVASAVNKDPEVTVLPDGVISMTWKAYEMLGTPGTVEFFFDRDREVMGLAPAEDEGNGYMVRRPKAGSKGRVSVRGTSVFKFYAIELLSKHRTVPTMENGLLTFPVRAKVGESKVSASGSTPKMQENEETNLA
ncbi:hypothetical protein ACHAAC_14765 [Aeromicrobium sp. CF4.19]|uniref:hypothetical protein n=1 Tax=Aeromicrobium sp. CF4.19 TaxID=3373082 RepID=UPI003EE5E456